MFCPSCKAEFRKGIFHCPDCDVDLVEQLPKEEKKASNQVIEQEQAYDMVSLMTIQDKVQAELLMNMLRNNGISCFKKANTAGGYLELYSGNNIYGEDIYVHTSNYAEAMTLCQELLEEDEDFMEEDEEFDRELEKMHEKRKMYNRSATIACRIILILAIGVTLLTWITDFIF